MADRRDLRIGYRLRVVSHPFRGSISLTNIDTTGSVDSRGIRSGPSKMAARVTRACRIRATPINPLPNDPATDELPRIPGVESKPCHRETPGK
jgi:hypothetical protein